MLLVVLAAVLDALHRAAEAVAHRCEAAALRARGGPDPVTQRIEEAHDLVAGSSVVAVDHRQVGAIADVPVLTRMQVLSAYETRQILAELMPEKVCTAPFELQSEVSRVMRQMVGRRLVLVRRAEG